MDFRKAIQDAIREELMANKSVSYMQSAGAFKSKKNKDVNLIGMSPKDRRDYVIKELMKGFKPSKKSLITDKDSYAKKLEKFYNFTLSAKKNYEILYGVLDILRVVNENNKAGIHNILKLFQDNVNEINENAKEHPELIKRGSNKKEYEANRELYISAKNTLAKAKAKKIANQSIMKFRYYPHYFDDITDYAKELQKKMLKKYKDKIEPSVIKDFVSNKIFTNRGDYRQAFIKNFEKYRKSGPLINAAGYLSDFC
jgi:hypothetical protein